MLWHDHVCGYDRICSRQSENSSGCRPLSFAIRLPSFSRPSSVYTHASHKATQVLPGSRRRRLGDSNSTRSWSPNRRFVNGEDPCYQPTAHELSTSCPHHPGEVRPDPVLARRFLLWATI